MIEIDGGIGEGGGQMLRSALTLSILTGKPFRMVRIRANRPKPGLAAQHLEAVHAAARICEADVEGDVLGSSEILFKPKRVRSGDFEFEIATAGSTLLVFQTVYLPLAFAGGGTVSIKGGTHTKWAPPFDYIEQVFCSCLSRMGLDIKLGLERAGYYPKGGGRIVARIPSVKKLNSLRLEERGDLRNILAYITISGLPSHIAEREISTIRSRLGVFGNVHSYVSSPRSSSPGNSVMVLCEFAQSLAGFAVVGEKGKPAEEVANEAADEAVSFLHSNGAVDVRCADQLLLPFAIAEGGSFLTTERLSDHIKTNCFIISKFISRKIEMEEKEKCAVIRIGG